MNRLPFDQPGRFWRGNLHTHSTRSDGQHSPEETCRRYRENGYDFISLTDHFLERYNFPLVDTRPFRCDDFTTILGAELHAGQTRFGGIWHLLAVGLPLDFAPPAADESGPQIAARAMAAGAYVAAAHPAWYTVSQDEIVSLKNIHAVEVFNATAIDHNDRADSWHITDILLSEGHDYLVCATDDFHGFPRRADFARGWVWVKSESLEPDALLAALKQGHYYSSTGPRIVDVQVTSGKEVYVRCSPVDHIFVTGRGPVSFHVGEIGATEARLSLEKFDSPYCRVTVRDAFGGRAWTNPIWLPS